ncbi:DNA adenine methylase [Vibrio parahaemolyticus]
MNCLKKFNEEYVIEEKYVKSKDYVQSPFRYPGGKFYALKFIIPFLNCIEHDEFREPFVGGGSVFFGKSKAKFNWINDLEAQMTITYSEIAKPDSCDKLIQELTVEEASRERHSEYKYWIPESNFEIAKRTYYINRTSYSGIINNPSWGYKVGNSSPPQNWERFLSNASKKLKDVDITNLDFIEVLKTPPIKKDNKVLMYLDPPYFHADTKRAYTKPFLIEDHIRLAEALKETEYFFCLSYDDCPEIRELYHWANIYERSWFYNTANTSGSRKMGNELIITNYKVKH